jgi:hypothetical protein
MSIGRTLEVVAVNLAQCMKAAIAAMILVVSVVTACIFFFGGRR